jgi:hypothetical protein
MKWLAILAAILVAAFAGAAVFCIKAKSYAEANTFTYRYRLQLSFSMDDRISTASSVIEISWRCIRSYGNKHDQLGPCYPYVKGQAPVLDLGARGVLVAALYDGETALPRPDQGISANLLCANAFGNRSTSEEEMPALRHLAGRRELSGANFPRLIWFSDPVDPKSARELALKEIPAIFGPTARLTEAFVEITGDPIVIDLPNKFPWFSELQRLQRLGQGPLSHPGRFQLVHIMFVGDDS